MLIISRINSVWKFVVYNPFHYNTLSSVSIIAGAGLAVTVAYIVSAPSTAATFTKTASVRFYGKNITPLLIFSPPFIPLRVHTSILGNSL